MIAPNPILDDMSPSKLDLLEKCPQAFAFRYVERTRHPRTSAQALGNAVDATTNAVYQHKLQTGETVRWEHATERFVAAHDYQAERVEHWEEGDSRGQQLDLGVRAVRHWRETVALAVQPVTQPQLRVEWQGASARPELDEAAGISSEFRVVTILDLVADVPGVDGKPERVVIDHKASGKRWNAADALRSSQAPSYFAGTGVPRFQWHVLRTDLVKPQTMVVATTTTKGTVDHLVQRMAIARRVIAQGLRTGDWQPRRNQTLCTRRWCSDWHRCEQAHGGTVTP